MARDSQTRQEPSVRRHPWLSTALLLLTCFLVINRALLTRQGSPVWDADGQAAPWQMLVADHARAGRLLQWNPWTNGGSPDFAEPQVGAFSPLAILAGLITGGTSGGFIFYWLLVWALAGVGIVCLARHLETPTWGAFVVGLAFLFSGFFTGHAEHMSHLHTMAWFPFVIWRFDTGLTQRRFLPILQAGALWGLSALAGYPGLVMIGGGYCFLWAVGRVACGRVRPGFALLALTTLCGIGLVVLSPTYAGFMIESQGYSDRAGQLTYDMATTNALHPGALISFASPYLNSLHLYNLDKLWAYTDISSCSLYVGPLVTCLALFAILSGSRNAWRRWLLGVALICILFALAKVFPFHRWLYQVFPPFRYIRHPAVFRDFVIFSMIVLALYACRDLDKMIRTPCPREGRKILILSMFLGLGAIVGYRLVLTSVADRGDQVLWADTHVLLVWSAVPLIIALILARSRLGLGPGLLIALLMAFAVCDASFSLTLSSHMVYTTKTEIRDGWIELDSRHRSDLDLGPSGFDRQYEPAIGPGIGNKNLPTKIPVFRAYSALKNRFHSLWARRLRLVSLVTGPNRTWFCPDAEELPQTDELFAAYTLRTMNEMAIPMAIHKPMAMKSAATPPPMDSRQVNAMIEALPMATRIPVRVTRYEPQHLDLKVQCPTDGWLLVTDRWAPGWQAVVNNNRTQIWGGAFIFRAVQVKAGLNRIQFAYHPFGFPWLLILSWGTLAAIGLGSLLPVLLRRRLKAARGT